MSVRIVIKDMNIDSQRLQINPRNFIQKIELLKKFFPGPMDAIHCFYTIVNYWDETSVVPHAQPSHPNLLSVVRNGKYQSDMFAISQSHHDPFRKIVESHYVFTNQEAGIEVDYYFSRFDEVISRLDPAYTKQHGIFFTDINLSKFALWFVHHYFEKRLSEKYVVFDPAGGFGEFGHKLEKESFEAQSGFRTATRPIEDNRTSYGNGRNTPKNRLNNRLNNRLHNCP